MNKADLQRAIKTAKAGALADVYIMIGDQLTQITEVLSVSGKLIIKAGEDPVDVEL